MSGLAALFVRPAEDGEVPLVPAHAPRSGRCVAVVGGDRRALAAGCATALGLLRGGGGACIVSVRGGVPAIGWRAAPARAARGLADAARAVGVVATVAGRLVLIDLDADPLSAWEQAALSAGPGPRVLVEVGVRDPRLEPVLAGCDAVGVIRPARELERVGELALAGLPAGSVMIDGAVGPVAALAIGGVAVVPSLARAVAPLVGAVLT